MEQSTGVYVMRVACMLSGMHPQTLRKYERAGLVVPSRSKTLRMYSDEDIARLRMIRHLVDEVGLNLAGVELALNLRAKVLNMKKALSLTDVSDRPSKRLAMLLDEIIDTVDEVVGGDV